MTDKGEQPKLSNFKDGKNSSVLFMWEDVIDKHLNCDKCKYGQIDPRTGIATCPYYEVKGKCRNKDLVRMFLKNAPEIVTYENFVKLITVEILRDHAADLDIKPSSFVLMDKLRDLHKLRYGDKQIMDLTVNQGGVMDVSGLLTEASIKAKNRADEIITKQTQEKEVVVTKEEIKKEDGEPIPAT